MFVTIKLEVSLIPEELKGKITILLIVDNTFQAIYLVHEFYLSFY